MKVLKLDHDTWQRPSFQLGFQFGQSKGITVNPVISIFAHLVSVPPSQQQQKKPLIFVDTLRTMIQKMWLWLWISRDCTK